MEQGRCCLELFPERGVEAHKGALGFLSGALTLRCNQRRRAAFVSVLLIVAACRRVLRDEKTPHAAGNTRTIMVSSA